MLQAKRSAPCTVLLCKANHASVHQLQQVLDKDNMVLVLGTTSNSVELADESLFQRVEVQVLFKSLYNVSRLIEAK